MRRRALVDGADQSELFGAGSLRLNRCEHYDEETSRRCGRERGHKPPHSPIVPEAMPWAPDTRGMLRQGDGAAATIAAQAVAGKRSKLQVEVIGAFVKYGSMGDRRLETLPEFEGRFRQSTVRKRRSELFALGILVDTGETDHFDGSTFSRWALAPGFTLDREKTE